MNDLLTDIGRRLAGDLKSAYYVGGCVRDCLLGQPVKDVDIAVSGDPFTLGRALAKAYRGHVFWLHQEEGVVRVILPEADGLQVDLTLLRGSIEEDLLARDLTINAMGMPVVGGLQPSAEVLDPAGGQADLVARRIRFVTPGAPERDPLRALRALRFRWKLGFTLDPATARRVRECAPLLARVSTERIRDELFQLLRLPDAPDALAECLDCDLGRWLYGVEVPIAPGEGLPGPAASARRVLDLLGEGPPELRRLLDAEVTPPRTRRQLLVWAAALEPVGTVVAPDAAARYLALSNDERRILDRGLAGAAAARELTARWPAAGRHRLRFFKAAAPAGVEAVLLAGARDGWAPAYAELLDEALHRHYWPEPPLLTGVEVMQLTGLEPGPRVGQVLQDLEEARADGVLRNQDDAVDWLRERYGRT